MPDAIITSTESTFGTISGTFAADQSTITGTVTGIITGTLSGSVGVPGPQGPAGPGSTWGGIAGVLSNQLDLQGALDLKAPLASPAFTGNPTAPTAALGDNDTSLATTAFVQQELLSGTANARNLEVYVRNQTGATLTAGTIVYINGATGNRPTVTKAQANNDANSAQTFGFVKTSIANNGFGYVIVRGELENVDTSALTEGVQLYLSPTTPGTWTTTKPSAPQHLVYVGICVRAHPTQGVILVAVQNGYELNELHDVQIVSPTNGQVLKYNSSTGLWYNGLDVGVPAGGTAGQFLTKIDGTDYNTDWTTVNLSAYAVKANNLSDLTNFATARDNLGLGSLSSPTFAGVTAQGSGANVANLTPTSLSLTHATSGSFTIQPSVGITFPNGSVQTTAFTGIPSAYISSVSSPLTVTSGNLSIDLSAYLTTATAASTYQTQSGMSDYLSKAGNLSGLANTGTARSNLGLGSLAVVNDAPSDGSQYARKNGAWDVVTATSSYITSVSSPLSVTSGNLTIDLSAYLTSATAASTYQTQAGMSSYLTTSAAASTYQTIAGMSSYLTTSAAASTYLTQSNAASTYQTLSGMSSYAPKASPALTGNVTITSNSSGAALFIEQAGTGNILTLHDQASDTSFVAIDQNGKVNTIPSTTTNAGFNLPHGAAPSTFVDGDVWTTTAGLFVRINGVATQMMDLNTAQTVGGNKTFTGPTLVIGNSVAAGTIGIGTGAVISGSTRTINIGTASAAGSTNAIVIGGGSGTSTTTLQGTTNGVTAAADTNSVALATTAYVVGQAGSATPLVNGTAAVGTSLRYARQDHVHPTDTSRAALAGATFTGEVVTPASTTGTAGLMITPGVAPSAPVNGEIWATTSDLQVRLNGVTETVAEQSWVTAQGYITSSALTPYLTSATAASTYQTIAGMSSYLTTASAASTYAPLASPTFTGTVTIPSGASISGYATTASLASYAPLASPALSGTPTAPTATVGTNTTQIATTAFVLANAGSTFATDAQVVTGTSTTTALNPGHAGFLKADPRLRQLGPCNNTTVSGSGAITGGSGLTYSREMYLGSLAAGRAGYTYGYIGSEAGMLTSKANKNQINFSKKIWVSGSCSPGITSGGTSYVGDANTVARVSFGGYSTNTTGDMTQKGIGWRKTGGTASFISLSVHNGTTLTNVATTVAVAANEVIDWVIYSDGTGNVTLYINGTQAATTSAGPTGTTTAGHNAYLEQVEGTGTPTVRHAMHAHSGWIYLAD